MVRLVVENLEDHVSDLLRERADRNGRTLEEEVHTILRQAAVDAPHNEDLGTWCKNNLKPVEGEAEVQDLGQWCIDHMPLSNGEPVEFEEFRGEPARPAEFGE